MPSDKRQMQKTANCIVCMLQKMFNCRPYLFKLLILCVRNQDCSIKCLPSNKPYL